MDTMGFDGDTERMIRANEANWDARTPIHVASDFYSVATRDPGDWFADYEWSDLGDVEGKDVAHLQCHIGAETLAFARRGARVVGLDISGESVAAARRIAEAAGLAAQYVRSDVYAAAEALGRNRFDLVYTGKGALCYLPDLTAWAAQVSALLRPGGQFYLVEFHPLLDALGPIPAADGSEDLLLRHDYLAGRGHLRMDGSRTYTDGPGLPDDLAYYEWRHGLGEIVTALVRARLRITLLRESEEIPWSRWTAMTSTAGVWHRLPDSAPRIPLMFAVKAVKEP